MSLRERNATLPHPPAIVQAACPTEGGEGGEEVGEAGFPCAFAGKTGGELGRALRAGGVGEQLGHGGKLFGERGGPRCGGVSGRSGLGRDGAAAVVGSVDRGRVRSWQKCMRLWVFIFLLLRSRSRR